MSINTETPVEGLIKDLAAKESIRLQSEIYSPTKQPYFYFSGIHQCSRNLYYLLTEGENRPPIDEYLAALFAEGKRQELIIKSELAQDGYDVIRSQERLEMPYQGPVESLRGQIMAVGKIDGVLVHNGVHIPMEIKATGEYSFKRIETVDDLLDSQFTEKWVKQLLMYMYAKECDYGLFIISDFRGHRKRIPVYLGNHMEVAEAALKTMEIAWAAKASGQIPNRMAYHSKVCGKCSFAATCLPSEVIGGSESIDDPELESMLSHHETLKTSASEYKELHDEIKDRFKGRPMTTVSGHYQVIAQTRIVKRINKDLLTDEEIKKATESKEESHVKIKDLTIKS